MLVLSRKEGEKIRLGDDILITVVKISSDKVRLGIKAPSNVLVLRDELELHVGETTELEVEFSPTIPLISNVAA